MKKQTKLMLYGGFSSLLIVLLVYFFFFSSFFTIDTIGLSCSDESNTLPASLHGQVESLLHQNYMRKLLFGDFKDFDNSPYLRSSCTYSLSKGHLQLYFPMAKIIAHVEDEETATTIGFVTEEGLFFEGTDDADFLKNKGLKVIMDDEFARSLVLSSQEVKLMQLIHTVIGINQKSYLISSLKCSNNNINDSFLYTLVLQGCYTKLSFKKDASFSDINAVITKVKQMDIIDNSKNNTIDVYHDAIVVRNGKLGGC